MSFSNSIFDFSHDMFEKIIFGFLNSFIKNENFSNVTKKYSCLLNSLEIGKIIFFKKFKTIFFSFYIKNKKPRYNL